MLKLEILFTILIVILSIILPFYYAYKKKIKKEKFNQQILQGKKVTESEKIRVYLDNINEKFRAKHK